MPLKPKKAFKNRHTVWTKASTLLFLLQGGRWGELTTSVYMHTCACALRELQKQRWPLQPSWPCTRPTSKVMDRRHSCLLVQQKTPSCCLVKPPRLLPPRLPLPCRWATQEGQCSCNFLISVYNPQVESTCNQLPCISDYMQRQVSTSFLCVVVFSSYVPSCCMSGSAFIVSLPHDAELVH